MELFRKKWRPWALRALLLALIVGAWAYEARPGHTSSVVLPTISSVISRLWSLIRVRETWSAVGLTLFEVVVSLMLSVVIGFVLGFLGSRTRFRADLTQSMVGWAYMVPLVLVLPIFQLWFGFGIQSKIAYAVANSFLPIAMNTVTGFRKIEARYIRVGDAYGASKGQMEWLIKLPASLPFVLAGVRTGAALSLISVILAETLAANRGIGSSLALAGQILDTESAFAYIVIILFMVAVVQAVIDRTLGRGTKAGQVQRRN